MSVVERAGVVAAPPDEVWRRVTTFEGITHELQPWLTMSVPRASRGLDVTTVPVGQPLGRAWIRLLGVLPVDADDLVIAELEPGRFLERSTMLSASTWEHERTLTAVDGGTRVHDRVSFTTRIPGGVRLHEGVVRALFAHRHRRLAGHFA